jgi:hypothetical protein
LRLSTLSETARLGPPLVLALAAVSACDTSSTAAPTTLDPPHLTVDSIQSVGAPTWTPETPCLTPGTDPAKTLSVNVGPRDASEHLKSASNPPVPWTMAPPGACSGTPPCGYLELTMDACNSEDPSSCGTDPSSYALIVAGSPSIPVSMAKFANPLGFYRFHVELKNQDGTPAEDGKGKTYPAEVVVELKESCGTAPPPPKDSGAPHRDAGSDAQVIGPDTGPGGPTDSSVTPVPDASVPDSAPPPSDATTRPDGAGDARVRDATAGDSEPPVVPPDAPAPI